MSKRSSPCCNLSKTRVTFLALLSVILVIGFAVAPALADNTAVRVSLVDHVPLGSSVNVDVTVDNLAGLRGFGGFDFLFAYDALGLTFESATPGASLDSCGWEYFTYRVGATGDCGGPCPSGFVRIVALAETNNANHHPTCFLEGISGTLATLKFLVTDNPNYICTFFPVGFYWLDCGDNSMASIGGDTLYISRRVYDYTWQQDDITGQPGYGGWQGIAGNPDCMSLLAPQNYPDTSIDFYTGGVDILCADSIDSRGDINLNGIVNEIADLVMFGNYFLYGLSAFPSGMEQASIAASDVNADGRVLTFRDAAYLMRIIYGDALPFPKRPFADSLNAYFRQDTTNHTVEVEYPGLLAGAFMLVRGNITPAFVVPLGFYQTYYFDGTFTRILILGDPDHRYGSGVWFTYDGTGSLERVETTDWFDSDIEAHIAGDATACGDVDGSGGVNISDAVYLVLYIFGGGQPPHGSSGGDVDCNGICNISDVVYLMWYIFGGGSAPCADCK